MSECPNSKEKIDKKRLVHDVPYDLNKNNYNDIHYLNCKDKGDVLLDIWAQKMKKDIITIKSTSNCEVVGKERAYDFISAGDNPVTLPDLTKNINSIEDAFDLLFHNEMLNLFVTNINANIENKLPFLLQNKQDMFESSK